MCKYINLDLLKTTQNIIINSAKQNIWPLKKNKICYSLILKSLKIKTIIIIISTQKHFMRINENGKIYKYIILETVQSPKSKRKKNLPPAIHPVISTQPSTIEMPAQATQRNPIAMPI